MCAADHEFHITAAAGWEREALYRSSMNSVKVLLHSPYSEYLLSMAGDVYWGVQFTGTTLTLAELSKKHLGFVIIVDYSAGRVGAECDCGGGGATTQLLCLLREPVIFGSDETTAPRPPVLL